MFDDQSILDGQEVATFTSVRNSGNVAATLTDTVPLGVTTRELLASGGRYQAGDQTWTTSTRSVPFTPKMADTITDSAGNVWTVLDVTTSTFASCHKFTTRNLAVANDLHDSLDVYRPALQSQTASGDRKPNFQPFQKAVACRVQETTRSVEDTLGKKVTAVNYSVIFAGQIPGLSNEDQLRWNGKNLQVTAVFEADRIDMLQRAEAVWRPDN